MSPRVLSLRVSSILSYTHYHTSEVQFVCHLVFCNECDHLVHFCNVFYVQCTFSRSWSPGPQTGQAHFNPNGFGVVHAVDLLLHGSRRHLTGLPTYDGAGVGIGHWEPNPVCFVWNCSQFSTAFFFSWYLILPSDRDFILPLKEAATSQKSRHHMSLVHYVNQSMFIYYKRF